MNDWLHWLPVSLHKKLVDYIVRKIYSYWRRNKLAAAHSENGGSVGLSTILEADLKHIVNIAHDSYEQ